jgi:hypothetical protein
MRSDARRWGSPHKCPSWADDPYQTRGASSDGREISPAGRRDVRSVDADALARMSEIADHLAPNMTVLFNESFAATNEREGSEIARQVVSALVEKGVKVFFVTHLHAFARGLFEHAADRALFLRAERRPDGTRSFRLVESEPLPTSHGKDLYQRIFAASA